MFAVFIMLLMWTVTILALWLTAKLVRTNGVIGVPLISLSAVLLLSFTALRNAMPNSPALGALADFVSYLWCEPALGLAWVACSSSVSDESELIVSQDFSRSHRRGVQRKLR